MSYTELHNFLDIIFVCCLNINRGTHFVKLRQFLTTSIIDTLVDVSG